MPDKEKKEKKEPAPEIPPLEYPCEEPKTVWELINQYGTYEIQPTTDTDHIFPTIGAGLPRDFLHNDERESGFRQ